ncbi:MAG: ribonuclease D [Gammaproteobacteria bacterium]|nr:ribonuclease D [Gammaproteobacteria bacterium]
MREQLQLSRAKYSATAAARMITSRAMTAIPIISDARALAQFVAALGCRDGWVSVDTEFLRERTFTPKLCLVQLTDGAQSACVDPLAVQDLSPLGELLADRSRRKIFHSCRQDLEAIDTRLDARAAGLYDTQLAAAFCGHGAQTSYAALVEALCDVRLPKAHTRADWSRRPLPRAELEYALDDIKYLQPLRAILDREMASKGYAEWHREECEYAARPSQYRADPATAWRRIKGVAKLDATGQSCAQLLAAWRERRALQSDRPRNWILPGAVLLTLCRKRPTQLSSLSKIKHIAPGLVKKSGAQILDLIAQGKRNAPPLAPLPPLNAEQRGQVKRILSRIAEVSEQTGISQTLIASRPEVEDFTRAVNHTDGAPGTDGTRLLQGWRRQLIGEEILTRVL